MPTICIIDDDHELFALLGEYLEGEGFCCLHAPDPEQGLAMAASGGVDAVILDVMLPEINGFEVLRRLRTAEKTQDLPVIMLTARDEEIDRVVGLEMGADDYLGKPFSPRELTARLRALLRRSSGGAPAVEAKMAVTGDVAFSPQSLTVTVGAEKRTLTVPEMRLLSLLFGDAGTVVSRDRLYAEIFGHPAYHGDRSLDMLVSRLRKKLGPMPGGGERIRAARGEGYVYLKLGDE